jgi:ribosomal protein S18 acetylase RimI-like enzyme
MNDLEKTFPLMKELRPHLSLEDYLSTYRDAHRESQYTIAALEENHQILGLMGYRVVTDFVRGRHLYIDDLVVAEKARSKGLGAELLKHAEKVAADMNCKSLRLSTGVENTRGMKFYESNSWIKRAVVYTKKI